MWRISFARFWRNRLSRRKLNASSSTNLCGQHLLILSCDFHTLAISRVAHTRYLTAEMLGLVFCYGIHYFHPFPARAPSFSCNHYQASLSRFRRFVEDVILPSLFRR